MIPTKTIVPRRPENLLSRPRLVDRLHQHVGRALTLISAPAGYGKTTLLVDFSHDAPFPVCWLSLDESDRDLYTFVEGLVGALHRRFPDFGRLTDQALQGSPNSGPDPSALAGAIVQDMIEHVPDFFGLVLDDYHVLDQDLAINQLVESLLRYRPDHCHLVIASRTVPPELPIVLLAARNQLASIGQADLAFTTKEVQALMNQMHQVNLTLEQANALVTASEGWITGILLSTAAMWQGMRDLLARASLQDTPENEVWSGPIYTYLAEQVFMAQPPDLQNFMLTLSTPEEIDARLCREALGLTHVTCTLERLERRGVFLTVTVDDDGKSWYRYHHLFRDFLQERLRARYPDRFQALHRRAGAWFEADEQWERAVTHYLTAGDWLKAGRVMDASVRQLFWAKRMRTLLAWYEALPQALYSQFPRLLLFAGRALIYLGHLDEALPVLSRSEAFFAEQGKRESVLFAALQRASIYYIQGHYVELFESVQEVLDRAEPYPAPTAEAHRLLGLACLNLSRPEEALTHLKASLELHRQLGLDFEIAMSYVDLSLALGRLGRLSESWNCLEKAIDFFRRAGPSDHFALALNNVACERYYLLGNYKQALSYLQEALDVAQIASAPRERAFTLLSTADLYRDLGAVDHSLPLYAQAEQTARQLGDAPLINFALNGTAQAQLMSGDATSALGLAVQARDQAQSRGDVYQLGLGYLTLGAARLEVESPAKALDDIGQAHDLLTQCGARRDLTRTFMLLARARQAVDDEQGALDALEQALQVGIETQSYHYLVIEGQRIFDLLKQLLERHPADRRPAQIMERIRALPDVARETLGGLAPAALPHSPSLRFYGFGPGSAEKDSETISLATWRSAQARYLTFYFLVHPSRSRDQILATFWPDSAPGKAVATFHWVKHKIHRALERKLILFQDDLYRFELHPDCWFDVAAFESLLDGQDGRKVRLEQAVALYQGDFLEGYDEKWCWPIRERLRLRYRDALVELGELYTLDEQFDSALTVLRQAIAVDEWHEPTVRALMRLHALAGRRSVALSLFNKLEQQLRQELGASPAPETQDFYQAIQAGGDF